LCFVDEISVTKGYCAAEIEAALRLRAKTNSPKILIITDNDLDINKVPNALPIFKVLFSYEHDFRQPVRIIREDSGIPDLFWAEFEDPDITDSVLPHAFQSFINSHSVTCSLILKALLYFFGLFLLLVSSGQIGAIIRGEEISLPLYKILLPPYNTVLYELPVWALFPLTFAVTYVFIWLWNDIFRIYKVDRNFLEFLTELRLVVLLFGTAQLIRQVPTLGQNGIMGIFLCAFLAISMSEDAIGFLTTYEKSHKMRSEARESVITKYADIDKNHTEFNTKCDNYLSQCRAIEIWKEALIVNDIKDINGNNGNKDDFKVWARSFALLKDNSIIEQEVQEFEELVESTEADGSSWSEISLLQCLGESEFLLGRAQKAFKYLSRSNVYMFHINMFPPTIQWRILRTELGAAIALSHCEGKSQEAETRFRKLAYKCRQQSEKAEPYLARILLTADKKIDNIEDQLAVQWWMQANNCLDQIPDEYKIKEKQNASISI
jgi:hypothetical protein